MDLILSLVAGIAWGVMLVAAMLLLRSVGHLFQWRLRVREIGLEQTIILFALGLGIPAVVIAVCIWVTMFAEHVSHHWLNIVATIIGFSLGLGMIITLLSSLGVELPVDEAGQ